MPVVVSQEPQYQETTKELFPAHTQTRASMAVQAAQQDLIATILSTSWILQLTANTGVFRYLDPASTDRTQVPTKPMRIHRRR